jgi:hypothetical protein
VITYLTDSPKPPPSRITLTLSAANAARQALFVVTGEGKAPVLQEILDQDSKTYPAGLGGFYLLSSNLLRTRNIIDDSGLQCNARMEFISSWTLVLLNRFLNLMFREFYKLSIGCEFGK